MAVIDGHRKAGVMVTLDVPDEAEVVFVKGGTGAMKLVLGRSSEEVKQATCKAALDVFSKLHQTTFIWELLIEMMRGKAADTALLGRVGGLLCRAADKMEAMGKREVRRCTVGANPKTTLASASGATWASASGAIGVLSAPW